MASDTLITFATYNELENLPRLVADVLRVAPTADLLVIDDASPDGTGQWCESFAQTEPRLRCLHRGSKQGLGTATIAAMEHAIAGGYRYLLNMDADFSHPPEAIPRLIAAMEEQGGADVAIGSRYIKGGRIVGWPLLRHLMSRGVNWYARWLLRLSTRDCSGAFRCYRVDLLRQLDFSQIVSRGYSFQEEILWRLQRQGARLVETPITFLERQHGHSKINTREAWSALRIIFRLGIGRDCCRT